MNSQTDNDDHADGADEVLGKEVVAHAMEPLRLDDSPVLLHSGREAVGQQAPFTLKAAVCCN